MPAQRLIACVALVLSASWSVAADDAEVQKAAKQQAEACQKAFVAKDFDKLVASMPPAMVEALGGRDKAVAAAKEGVKSIEDKGFAFKSSTVGEPAAPITAGKNLYTVVPITLEMSTPTGAKLKAKGGLVGISSDNGKTWKFADSKPGREVLKKFLPDLPEELTLPKVELVKD